MKRAVSTLGRRTIDRRSSVGKALSAWRADLLADLGGPENVSTQELALVEEAVKTKLILDSIDAWLLTQPNLIDKRKRAVLPVVRDRNTLVMALRGLLGDLGLKRRTQEPLDLGSYLARKSEQQARADNTPAPTLEDTGAPAITNADENTNEPEVTP